MIESHYNQEKENPVPHQVEYFTGIRGSGDLTIANLLAIEPIVGLQERGKTVLFVADIHGATTESIQSAKQHTLELARMYIAMGLNPEKSEVFVQSHLEDQIALATLAFSRHVSIGDLLRQPSLKDKVKEAESASVNLALYPLMMTADIALQSAHYVPVGKDQVAHVELARGIIRRVNKNGAIVALPEVYQEEPPPRYLGLKGDHKMSKSEPELAILLADDEATIIKKIKRSETASESVMTPSLASHIQLIQRLARNDSETLKELTSITDQHMKGERVMGTFKALFQHVVTQYVSEFNKRLKDIPDTYVQRVLDEGNHCARERAAKVIERMRDAGLTF